MNVDDLQRLWDDIINPGSKAIEDTVTPAEDVPILQGFSESPRFRRHALVRAA